MTTIALEGTGAAIAFSVSSFTSDLITLTLPDETVESMETTHLGTTGAKTSKPGKLKAIGPIECEFDHNPAAPSLLKVEQAFTISWPLRTGQATPYKRVYSGYVSKQGGEPMEVGKLMRSKVTITVSGDYSEVQPT